MKQILFDFKTNKTAHRFIAWSLIALMMFGLVPMSPLQVKAAETIVEPGSLTQFIKDSGGTANLPDAKEDAKNHLKPTIASSNYSDTAGHILEYTLPGGNKGFGYCMNHGRGTGHLNELTVTEGSKDELSVLTKDIFYLGASYGDTSAGYIAGIVKGGNDIAAENGKPLGYFM